MRVNFQKIEMLFLSMALIMIAGLIINVGNVFAIIFPFQNKGLLEVVILAVSAPIGFIILPLLLSRVLNLIHFKIKFNLMQAVLLFVVIAILALYFFHSKEIIHDLIIAICEEFLFRYVIFNILSSQFDKKATFIIGSLLFASLLHLNGNFIINLAIKFPAGLLLYYLADTFGLQSSIAFHWLYNMVIGQIV
ncbi:MULTISPECIES: type II CAAX endopeptidase family protein [Heyndrickxia]|jgi:membrane protease YdiL (CAAX protease family)|uniref:type II CAAX endopeptidase family protein n=1 Tax=Heyndrickxia TaxID=2837504 RepID=UPI001459C67F|nr:MULTISPECIES: type II CAAX endopeptidase family protein [Heyndrickxia]MED4345326.1 type II CAAX endopeptidase family protein [Heyndrickxia coagulans]MED4977516.1 type II CAAX endopeptidase family protein [Weizmannia sp. CD-2023]NMH85854.1 CPBP family intramembrane metalloprotease [Heyndrickxia coagulans]QWU06445.1 CPBP family intramembrane metalloprotease [Heyndrickxia coagulans]UXC22225.1 CPBP family intramembrane metalloprotease [Heyndrickxia coagulans]